MGEESRRVAHRAAGETKETPDQEVSRLRGEIESARNRLGTHVTELDRRRHELLDWRLQLRRHAGLAAAIAGGLVLTIAGATALGARRARRRNTPIARARRVKDAVARLIEEPELVSKKTPQTVTNKVLSAAGATIAGIVARQLMRQMMPATAGAKRS